MTTQNTTNASHIKGYCSIDVCWQYLHDVATQLEQHHAAGRFCGTIALGDVEIQGRNFVLNKQEFISKGNAESDVWALAASAYELLLGAPIFNGMGEKGQSPSTPLPFLPDKEMNTLNNLMHKCLQKDSTKRPATSTIIKTAGEEVKKLKNKKREERIYVSNTKSTPVEEIDRKWPESMSAIKQALLCLLFILSGTLNAHSQALLDKTDEAYTLELIDAALMLRNNNEKSWNEAQYEFSKLLRLFTMMDELQDRTNDCALVSKNVKSFGLNRMIKRLKENKSIVQNTGKELLDGADSRFNYSIYEKGVKRGCTAVYDKLTGRCGKQVFIIIPHTAAQPYETELSTSGGKNFEPAHKDERGVTYYMIDTNDGPDKDDTLILKIKNKDTLNNRSFVIINHNYRNKE